jgi:hypothetical protein
VNGSFAVVLAHQGGWDEILLIVGPMVVVVLLLRLAKRRVDRSAATMPPPGQTASTDATDRSGPAPDER